MMGRGKEGIVNPHILEMKRVQEKVDIDHMKSIQYDDMLAKHEREAIRGELKEVVRAKFHAKLEDKLKQSTSLKAIHKSMALDDEHRNPFVQKSQLFGMSIPNHSSSQVLAHHDPAVAHHQMGPSESALPLVKSKGAAHFKRYVDDVRRRDYKMYLKSLNAVKELKIHEDDNQRLKQKLFKEKYALQMRDFRSNSNDLWRKMIQMDQSDKAAGRFPDGIKYGYPKESKGGFAPESKTDKNPASKPGAEPAKQPTDPAKKPGDQPSTQAAQQPATKPATQPVPATTSQQQPAKQVVQQPQPAKK